MALFYLVCAFFIAMIFIGFVSFILIVACFTFALNKVVDYYGRNPRNHSVPVSEGLSRDS